MKMINISFFLYIFTARYRKGALMNKYIELSQSHILIGINGTELMELLYTLIITQHLDRRY